MNETFPRLKSIDEVANIEVTLDMANKGIAPGKMSYEHKYDWISKMHQAWDFVSRNQKDYWARTEVNGEQYIINFEREGNSLKFINYIQLGFNTDY